MVSLLMVRPFRLAGLCLAAVLAMACDKVPLFAPSQSTITLTAGQRVLALNASAEVTAVVVESSGTSVQNGTAVRFSTTLGRVDPVEVETRNGVATTTFYAGSTSGIADVRATSGAAGGTTAAGTGANATSTATNVVTFTIGAAAVKTVTVRANPSSVPASGGTVEVSAVVLDANGQGVAGIPVTFRADQGTLTNIVSTSNATGVATVGLTTNVLTNVFADAGSAPQATTIVTLQVAPSITVTCLASGSTSSAGPSCTQNVGQPVTFTITKGGTSSSLVSAVLTFGDGESATLGAISSVASVTHSYSSVNAYTATVTATDGNGQTTTASVAGNVTARPPLTVTFATAAPDTATTTGHRFSFTLTVTAGAETTGTTLFVESVSWDFGDSNSASTSGLSTSHVYTATANRTVTATVRTQDGRSGTGRTTVAVNVPSRAPLTATFSTVTPDNATNSSHRFSFTLTAAAGTETVLVQSVSWDFGDGTSSVTTNGLSTSHVYTATSNRTTVTATVTTQDGRTATARIEVQPRLL